jgi:putative endopeptidase
MMKMRSAILACIYSSLIFVDCGSMTASIAAATNTPDQARPRAQIGEFGLDLSARELSVNPGDDFYTYANGSWINTFQIPADRGYYGSFTQVSDLSLQRVHEILEDASQKPGALGSNRQKVGDYYASFMDQAAIDAKGLGPIAEDLRRIQETRTRTGIAGLFGTIGYTSPLLLVIGADPKSPSRYAVNIVQGGLGLPDRDYYLNDDPKLKDIRQKYAEHIARLFELAQIDDAQAKAQSILAFETALARVQWDIEKRRSVQASYNPRTKKALIDYAPGFAWQAYFDAAELGSRQDFILQQLTAIRDSAKLIQQTPLETLKSYLAYHFIVDHSQVLPQALDHEAFAFYGTTLSGTPQQAMRWKRAVQSASNALGDAVGQIYVTQFFPRESKAKMQALVANLRVALRERIDALGWMTSETKKRAQQKLAAFTAKIGYPSKWKDYSDLKIVRGDPIGNDERAALWDWHRQLARIDQTVDRDEWMMPVSAVNAYYYALNNEIVFPAAILQPPFFDPNADDAVNYGGIGSVIGHEMGHGFDDQGRQFGPDGSLTDWWTPQDAESFNARAKRIIDKYSSFEALPALFVRGQNTIGENIGDLGGLNIALQAYHHSLAGTAAPMLEGLNGDQRLFLSFAQIWRAKVRDETLRILVMSDVHSPPYFRINGTVPNLDAWYAAFAVKPSDKLFVKPEDRVLIW